MKEKRRSWAPLLSSTATVVVRVYLFGKVCEWIQKVRKFQNENMKSSHCPKYDQRKSKYSVLSIQGKNFQIFCSYFGQCDDFIFSFWILMTFRNSTSHLTLRYTNRYLVAVISYRYAVKHNMVQGTYLHCTKYLRYFVITINYISTFITQGIYLFWSNNILPTKVFTKLQIIPM
jgi:hypothetical protein